MKLIVIRGPAGCGKTEIANILADRLSAAVVHADWLKTAVRHRHPEIADRHRIRQLAYEGTLRELKRLYQARAPVVIVEELLIDPDFVNALRRFGDRLAERPVWFRLKRDLDKLMSTEETPRRQARPQQNSRADLLEMERQLDRLPVPDEIRIDNNGPIDGAVTTILAAL